MYMLVNVYRFSAFVLTCTDLVTGELKQIKSIGILFGEKLRHLHLHRFELGIAEHCLLSHTRQPPPGILKFHKT